MQPLRRLSIIEQTAIHIREGIAARRWAGQLPGVLRLAAELDVSKDSVRAALRRLEAEGLLAPGGHGRRRGVVAATLRGTPTPNLRVGVLLRNELVHENSGTQRLLLQIQNAIEKAGFTCAFCPEPHASLGRNPRRLARVVGEMQANAWIVFGGSPEVLKWFAAQKFPTTAIGGRKGILASGIGLDGGAAFREGIRKLTSLGHRRITFICQREWRQPGPGPIVQLFCAELEAAGVRTNDYNVPDWEPTPAGFHDLLTSLYRITPPTAFIVDEPARVVALLSFLAQRGLRSPRDASIIAMNVDASLAWCRPAIAQFHYDDQFVIRYVTRWISTIARGRKAEKQIDFHAQFDPAETVGPAGK